MLINPRNIQAVARKEFYHIVRDYRSLYMAFALPLLLILLFGYALSLDVDNVKVVVVDHDRTDLTRDFASRLDASAYFDLVSYLPDDRAAAAWLDAGKATIALVIPPRWTETIRSNREAPLQVLIDASDPNIGTISRGYITSFVERYNSRLLADFLSRQGLDNLHAPVEGRVRVWFNEELESRNFIVPGIIAVIIMIVGAMLTSLVIAREYENGTMETIRSLPINAVEFLTGKAIPYFLIAMTDVLVALLMGQLLFGVVMKGSFWLHDPGLVALPVRGPGAGAFHLDCHEVPARGKPDRAARFVPAGAAAFELRVPRGEHAPVASVRDHGSFRRPTTSTS